MNFRTTDFLTTLSLQNLKRRSLKLDTIDDRVASLVLGNGREVALVLS
jgi:hypothetical protein